MTTTVPKVFAFHEFAGVAEAVADHVIHAQNSALKKGKVSRSTQMSGTSLNGNGNTESKTMERVNSVRSNASSRGGSEDGATKKLKKEKERRFKIALSGGSLIQVLHEGLLKRDDVQWGKWDIYFADERLVPFSSSESNYGLAKRKIFDLIDTEKYGTPKIYHIDESLINDPQECADNYEKI